MQATLLLSSIDLDSVAGRLSHSWRVIRRLSLDTSNQIHDVCRKGSAETYCIGLCGHFLGTLTLTHVVASPDVSIAIG